MTINVCKVKFTIDFVIKIKHGFSKKSFYLPPTLIDPKGSDCDVAFMKSGTANLLAIGFYQ